MMIDYKLYEERQIECAKQLRKKLISMEKSLSKFADKMCTYAKFSMIGPHEVESVLDATRDNLCFYIGELDDIMDSLRGRPSPWEPPDMTIGGKPDEEDLGD